MVVLINGAKSSQLSNCKTLPSWYTMEIYEGELRRPELKVKKTPGTLELIQKDIMKEADTKQFRAGGKFRILVGEEWTSKQKKIHGGNTLKAWFIIWK